MTTGTLVGLLALGLVALGIMAVWWLVGEPYRQADANARYEMHEHWMRECYAARNRVRVLEDKLRTAEQRIEEMEKLQRRLGYAPAHGRRQ